jgi:FixJ family two-component response regulator
MPGRDGASLADELRRRIPGIPIGLLTGYRNSPLVPSAERAGARLFPKPVIIQEVVEFLRAEIA